MDFPDTSFLCSLYRQQIQAPLAIAHMARRTGPLLVSSLLLLEFRQSVRLQVRLYGNDRTRGFPKAEATKMLRDLQSDLRTGILEMVEVDWAAVHQTAEELSGKYTEDRGHRLADSLHVATALHLGAEQFLTFDANQKKLAASEGMTGAV